MTAFSSTIFFWLLQALIFRFSRHKIVPSFAPPSLAFPRLSENGSTKRLSVPHFPPFSGPASRISFSPLISKTVHIFDRLKTLLPKLRQLCDISAMAQRTLLQFASQENDHLAKRFDFPRLSLTCLPQRAQIFLVQSDGRNGCRRRQRSGGWFRRGRFGF